MFDLDSVRARFPILKNKVEMQKYPLCFLDSASTSLKLDAVVEKTNDYYTKYSANMARSDYDLGAKVDEEVALTRAKVQQFINAKNSDEIVFTNNTTEGINLVAYGYVLKNITKDDEIIVSVLEHAANLLPWYRVSEMTGCKISYVPVDEEGHVLIDELEKLVSTKTKVIALAHVSNVLAQLIDAKRVAKIAHQVGAIFVLDGAQSVPHVPVDVQQLDCDFLVFSAHKMLGPTGVGVLYGKSELLELTDPLFLGGGMNLKYNMCGDVSFLKPPHKFEAGTPNLAGIIGFSPAIDFLNEIGMENVAKHEEEIRKYALKRLQEIPNIVIYNESATTGIITFNIEGIFAQDVATYLNSKGICVRSGQHCSKILSERFETNSTVRMSTYLYTSKDDIDRLIDALKTVEDFLDAYF